MKSERDVFIGDEINIREYLLAVLGKWYLVVSVLAVLIAIAWLFPRLRPEVPQYEARTKLLIVAPVSGGLLGEDRAGAVTNLSIETLSSLATANDLLQKIILEETLITEEPASHPLTIEELAGMLDPEVVTASHGGAPLLTMTVRGKSPLMVQRIANKWAEVFVQKNSELFTIQAGRSYEFILEQYEETQDALREQGEKRVQFIGGHPPELMEDELKIKRSDLEQRQNALLNLSFELALKKQDYQEIVTHLNELTFAGRWIGLQDEAEATTLRGSTIGGGGTPSEGGSVLASTPEQASIIQAREQFFTLQEQIKDFQENCQLTLLRQRLSIKLKSLGDYITQLETAENDVRALSRTLQALETEINRQSQFLVLSKAITAPALWQLLGPNPTGADWERIRELGLQTEELNPAFTSLTNRII